MIKNNGLKEIKYAFICPSGMNTDKLINLPEEDYDIDTTFSKNNEHLIVIREKNDDTNKNEETSFFEGKIEKKS